MNELQKLKNEIEKKVQGVTHSDELESVRVLYLGRKGKIARLMSGIKSVPNTEKPKYGQAVNDLKVFAGELFEKKSVEFTGGVSQDTKLDVTEPGIELSRGSLHVVEQVMQEMVEIFSRAGFSVAMGPEIETDWYNFEALNIPPNHPARDTQDTFYVEGGKLLRTHTSPVQIHVMETTKPPIRVIVPGRVYRRDSDPTHTPMFHQIEGLLIDESANFAELKGILTYFVHEFFGVNTKLRFRPHHFPFTEPSAEIDITCTICSGSGKLSNGSVCRVCKGTRWLEILGAGMVHPNVLSATGLDASKYRGFAFGMGIDRAVMLRYNIPDLRILFENDIRFLEQF